MAKTTQPSAEELAEQRLARCRNGLVRIHRHAALGSAEILHLVATDCVRDGLTSPALEELAGLDGLREREPDAELVRRGLALYYRAVDELGLDIPDPRATRLAETRKYLSASALMHDGFALSQLRQLLPERMAAVEPLITRWREIETEWRDRFRGEVDAISAYLDTVDGLDAPRD